MLFIAHRGNLFGPMPELENTESHILQAISRGFLVEIDVWFIYNQLYLGHDSPANRVSPEFLIIHSNNLVCHAKNAEALEWLVNNGFHCFSHENDPVVLTSRGWLWTYPGKPLTLSSILVMPEYIGVTSLSQLSNIKIAGICSDYAGFIQKEYAKSIQSEMNSDSAR